MDAPGPFRITPVAVRDACPLLARAMRDNPTHVAVFGSHIERRHRHLHAFFALMLPWIARRGLLLAAFNATTPALPISVFGLLPPGSCRPGPLQALQLASRAWQQLGPTTGTRCLRWLRAWQKHDTQGPHWHLGPLAVAPAWQGQGIGTALLRHGLAQAAETPAPCHLETDLPRNVALYRRLGFSVTAHRPVLGVTNWFMQRPAGHQTPQHGGRGAP